MFWFVLLLLPVRTTCVVISFGRPVVNRLLLQILLVVIRKRKI